MRNLAAMLLAATLGATELVTLPSTSSLVTIRLVFRTGAAADPPAKPGLASLTAAMIASGGSARRSYQQRIDELFPFASEISWQVDKEMTTFSTVTHIDNLDRVYALFREALLEPGWRPDDLARLRDEHINALRVNIRSNNDEELSKEVLYSLIYARHPYQHHNLGAVAALRQITLADLRAFYASHYTQPALTIGVAGGYPQSFPNRLLTDFARLPAKPAPPLKISPPAPVDSIRLTLVDKKTRAVAIAFGFPIDVKRGHPDYLPLLIAQSCFGQHRQSSGRLFQRIREARGLNYGDYAYLEYFPNGMFRFEPEPNLARSHQSFLVWIRPLEPPTAHFGFRLALFELDRLIRDGLTPEEFETTRAFLSKYVNLLTKTKTAELGYAIDSRFYSIPDFNTYVRQGLAKLSRDDVNQAIRKHLRPASMHVVFVTDDAAGWRARLLDNAPSPMRYNSPKPQSLLDEDRIVEQWRIPLRPENVQILPADSIFE
jgi:zinc protease